MAYYGFDLNVLAGVLGAARPYSMRSIEEYEPNNQLRWLFMANMTFDIDTSESNARSIESPKGGRRPLCEAKLTSTLLALSWYRYRNRGKAGPADLSAEAGRRPVGH